MSSFGRYCFNVYNKFNKVSDKSYSYKTLRGCKAKATSYLFDYIGNHTNKEIELNCAYVAIFDLENPDIAICIKYTDSLEKWEYYD